MTSCRVISSDDSERGNIEYRDATGWLSWRFRPSERAELRATMSRTERHTKRDGSVNQPGNSVGTLDDHRRFDTTTFRLEANADCRAACHSQWRHGVVRLQRAVPLRQPSHVRSRVCGRVRARADAVTLDSCSAPPVRRMPYTRRRRSTSRARRYSISPFAGMPSVSTTAFHDNQLSPRVSMQYNYDPATTLRVSWGRSAQTLRPDELQVQEGDTSFTPAQRATQIALSMERHLSPDHVLARRALQQTSE